MIEGIIYDGQNAAEVFVETKLTNSGQVDIRVRNQRTDVMTTVLIITQENIGELIGSLESHRMEWLLRDDDQA